MLRQNHVSFNDDVSLFPFQTAAFLSVDSRAFIRMINYPFNESELFCHILRAAGVIYVLFIFMNVRSICTVDACYWHSDGDFQSFKLGNSQEIYNDHRTVQLKPIMQQRSTVNICQSTPIIESLYPRIEVKLKFLRQSLFEIFLNSTRFHC